MIDVEAIVEKIKQEEFVPLSELIPCIIALYNLQKGDFIPLIPYDKSELAPEDETEEEIDEELDEILANLYEGWLFLTTEGGDPGFRGEFDHGLAELEIIDILFDSSGLWIKSSLYKEPQLVDEKVKKSKKKNKKDIKDFYHRMVAAILQADLSRFILKNLPDPSNQESDVIDEE